MGIAVRVKITGAREMVRAFRRLPGDARRELRDSNVTISRREAARIKAAAVGSPRQGPAVAPSVRGTSLGGVPAVVAGGGRRAGSQSRRSSGQGPTTAGDLVFGANFGAARLRQFPAKSDDYFFFSTVQDDMPAITAEWIEAADDVLRKWATD